MNTQSIVVIIPAYEPDEKMLSLLEELTISISDVQIIVVNDGSSVDKTILFDKAKEYAKVINHDKNYGKGSAIRTGLAYIDEQFIEDAIIVVADADGQHTDEDILKVIEKAKGTQGLILGSREFVGDIPMRSRFGNTLTRGIFRLATKVALQDTQTGLRAFHKSFIPYLLKIGGDRYEYEMNVLLKCAKEHVEIIEVPIQTVYIEENKSSHFHVIKDSFKIYREILRFSCSSFVAFIIDYTLYTVLNLLLVPLGVTQVVIISNLGARAISSVCNYCMNRKFVFTDKSEIRRSAIRYFLLVIGILCLNTIVLTTLVRTIVPNRFVAKILVEMLLFIVSYMVQRHYVFAKNGKEVKIRVGQ